MVTRLVATEGADRLIGDFSDDTIDALGGDDYVDAGDGWNVITGGTGNDVLKAGTGFDTYNFTRGDGRDVIHDTGGGESGTTNEVFLIGYAETELVYSYDPLFQYSFILDFNTSNDQIAVRNPSDDPSLPFNIRLEDGTLIDTFEIQAVILDPELVERLGTTAADDLLNDVGKRILRWRHRQRHLPLRARRRAGRIRRLRKQ